MDAIMAGSPHGAGRICLQSDGAIVGEAIRCVRVPMRHDTDANAPPSQVGISPTNPGKWIR